MDWTIVQVTTVDKYQGQQNDYILLSLVRTKAFGHLRDPRRLVVATSRARLGLYVFGRESLYKNCYELQPTFSQFLSRPTKLALVKGEAFKTTARKIADTAVQNEVTGLQEIDTLVNQMTWEWHSKTSCKE